MAAVKTKIANAVQLPEISHSQWHFVIKFFSGAVNVIVNGESVFAVVVGESPTVGPAPSCAAGLLYGPGPHPFVCYRNCNTSSDIVILYCRGIFRTFFFSNNYEKKIKIIN